MSLRFALATLIFCSFFTSVSAQSLIEAVDERNYDRAKQLITSGENVNKTNKKGQYPLWMAVWNGDSAMVQLLIDNKANVNQLFINKDSKSSCLEIACQEGHTAIVRMLVERGAPVDEPLHHGYTPLRIAARNGRLEIVQYLAGKGAAIDAKADDGATPLEVAASKGHLEIAQFLVNKGARVNHQDKEGDTPLNEAARAGHIETVAYLLAQGADINLKNQQNQTARDIAKINGQAKVEDLLEKTAEQASRK